MIICKVYFGSTHILFIWKRFFEKSQTVSEPLCLDEDETLMTSLLFLMPSHCRAGFAVCFLWLSLPGHYRVTDEAL